MSKRIIIIGGKTQSKSLAESLLMKKHHVTVISPDVNFCNRLSEINGLTVIVGDGSKTKVLEQADIYSFDIAIAMNEHDADNLVICEMCKKLYGVKRTVSLLSDTKRKPLFDLMGVDSVVCATSTVASIIEQQSIADEISRVIPKTDDKVRITEIKVRNTSPIVGKKLADISLPEQAIIGCLIRGEENIIPYGATVINSDDTLLLISTAESEQKAIEIITGRKKYE